MTLNRSNANIKQKAGKVNQPVFYELSKYGMAGAISTVLDMVILNVIKTILGWPLWIALALGFLVGTVNGYYMNSRWTFKYDTKGQEGKKFSQFVIVCSVGLGLTELIVNFYISYINSGFNFIGHSVSAINTGKLIAVVIVFFWNYSANKVWTFNTAGTGTQ